MCPGCVWIPSARLKHKLIYDIIWYYYIPGPRLNTCSYTFIIGWLLSVARLHPCILIHSWVSLLFLAGWTPIFIQICSHQTKKSVPLTGHLSEVHVVAYSCFFWEKPHEILLSSPGNSHSLWSSCTQAWWVPQPLRHFSWARNLLQLSRGSCIMPLSPDMKVRGCDCLVEQSILIKFSRRAGPIRSPLPSPFSGFRHVTDPPISRRPRAVPKRGRLQDPQVVQKP